MLHADHKKAYLEYITAAIGRQCKTTRAHIDKYRPVFANNRNTAGFTAAMKELIFTLAIQDAEGAHFKDPDGNDYLDMSMGFGVHLFGHKPALLETALLDQIKKGLALGPLYEEAAEVAQLIHELTGNERCAFYNTGTEAVMVAMRVARAATQKSKVVIFEGSYHGTHDSLLGLKTDEQTHIIISTVPGITQSAVNNTMLLQYGQAATLDMIKEYGHEIAAVLTEPVMSRHPELKNEEFLQQLRQLCTAMDIALIFDEVITGFRTGNGGAAALFNIQPDITTYGKVAGGGIPIGIVAGKSRYLDMIDGGQWAFGDASEPSANRTFTAGTFNHHPLAMAAAKTVLQTLQQQQGRLQEALNSTTAGMCHTLDAFFTERGYPISMTYFSSLFRFMLKGHAKYLFYALLKEGVYIWEGRNCFISTAHTQQDIDSFINRVQKCCFELEAAGMLTRRAAPSPIEKTIAMGAGISINKLLNKNYLALACRYLFATIPALAAARCSLTETAPPADADFTVHASHHETHTTIQVVADRHICDGWSLILFFKALAAAYNALEAALPLPVPGYAGKEVMPVIAPNGRAPVYRPAATVQAGIPLATIGAAAQKKLFAFLLYQFQKIVLQHTILPVNANIISVPVAGQLYHRRLKAFGQFTLYRQVQFNQPFNNPADELDAIEQQSRSRQPADAGDNAQPVDIVFNLDNLDFALAFAGAPATLLPMGEDQSAYPLVCNISRLPAQLVVSIKYVADVFTKEQAQVLLDAYMNQLQQNMHAHI